MTLMNQKKLAIALTVLGIVPFIALTLSAISGVGTRLLPVAPLVALHAYGAVIVSFVAGMHWGIHFCKRTEDSIYLISSFISLLIWLSLVKPGSDLGLTIVLVSLLLLWAVEYRLSKQRVTTAWFWLMRCAATSLTCACIVISIFLP